MSVFLIDTDILIDVSKNKEPATSWFRQAFQEKFELAICAINIAEFYSGIQARDRSEWDKFFETFEFWQITQSISRQAGVWRYEFFKKGLTVSTTDALIAATALAHSAALVTKNIKDYPMPQIEVLSLKEKLGLSHT